MRQRLLLTSNIGFTLIETLIALGVSAVALLTAVTVLSSAYDASSKAQSDVTSIAVKSFIRKALAFKPSANSMPKACEAVIRLDSSRSPNFDVATTAKNFVEVSGDNETLKSDGSVKDSAMLKIDLIYLTQILPIVVPGRTTYLADLVIQTRGKVLAQARKVATLSIELNSAMQIARCNVAFDSTPAQAACDLSFGMRWNAVDKLCEEALADDGVSTTFACPPGLRGSAPNCKPIPSSCASGQVATGYSLAQVNGCHSLPATAPVLAARNSVSVSEPEGAPIPPTPPLPVQPIFLPPPTLLSLTSSTSPARNPACDNSESVSRLSYDSCTSHDSSLFVHYSGNSCAWTELPPVSNSCEYQPAIPYVTPDLTAVQPDPPAPPDLSCQCNSRRIASGEFCMYCVQDADLGYGYADYTYGVSQCDSGNLKDIPNPGLYEPVATCGNTYGRARRIGDRFQQYSEIP